VMGGIEVDADSGAATGVHEDVTAAEHEPRWPPYMFRSRTRFFGLTRGPIPTVAAYVAWIAGHVIWTTRRVLGLARGKAVPHQFRDHLGKAFPRRHDFAPAVASFNAGVGEPPAWMVNKWR